MANMEEPGPSQKHSKSVDEPAKVLMEKNSKILNDFIASNDQVYIFCGNLPGEERDVVNLLCQRLGLGAKFRRTRTGRKIYVYKMNNEATNRIQVVMSRKRKNREEPQSCWDEKAFYDEFNRIWISQKLEKFLASNDAVYNFEDELSIEECDLVSQLSQNMGLSCTYSGCGIRKKTSVRKTIMEVDTTKVLESLPHVTFSEESNQNKKELEPPQHQHSTIVEVATTKVLESCPHVTFSEESNRNKKEPELPLHQNPTIVEVATTKVLESRPHVTFSEESNRNKKESEPPQHHNPTIVEVDTTKVLESLPPATFSEESNQSKKEPEPPQHQNPTIMDVDTTKVLESLPHVTFSEESNQNRKEPGQPQHQNPIVDESTRIRTSLMLENFLASKDEVYNFEANLSPEECVVVHQLSLKMGFRVEISGSGIKQKVSVHKIKKKIHATTKLENPWFTFSEESRQVLYRLLMHYPPADEGIRGETIKLQQDMGGTYSDTTDRTGQKEDDFFSRPYMSKDEITKNLEDLSARMKNPSDLKPINEKRSKLPIASFKDVITSTVESHQVVIISGEAGCGKTTQVPQYILDHMWGKGEACKIVCAQPHHISATSVSKRISSERGEDIGDNVGYKVRLESRGGSRSSIVLCTTGVLLRALVYKNSHFLKTRSLKGDISSIIIMDDIHERDRYSDLTLAMLRQMLPLNPHLRLILMSASVDTARFSQYFGACPIIHVTGFTYPVKTYYSEDVLSIVKSIADNHLDNNHELSPEEKLSLDEAINLAWSKDEWCSLLEFVSSKASPEVFNYQHSLTGLNPLMVFAGKGKVGDMCMLLFLGANSQLKAKDGTTALEIAEKENQHVAAELLKKHRDNDFSDNEGKILLDRYFATVNPEVDVVLIEQLIRKICIDSNDGGILVFLPGWDEIIRTRERLLASPFFNDKSKFRVISLRSMGPSIEQKVFSRPPHGCRKIVLSTNIAESAVTIDDVVYVIDTGCVKEKHYDPCNDVLTLQSSWISKASAKQREGCAGRCQPGICYHLYSKVRAASLPDFQVPEIRRMPIEELCLQVKLFDPSCKIEEFLSQTLDPPGLESIQKAVEFLQGIGALSVDEQLTQLGKKLGSLPVLPSTNRMLLLSILMNCLDPALTLACASEYKDPFVLPILPDEKERAAAARSELASLYGGCGDQFAVIAAFECWLNSKRMGLESRFCSQYFVSASIMNELSSMRKILAEELFRNGLIHGDVSSYCSNAHDPGILQAVLIAGMYPMVGKLLLPNESGKKFVVETKSGDNVCVNSRSLNSKLSSQKSFDCSLVVYDEITCSDWGMCIGNCTVVGLLPLFFLSKEIAVAPAKDGKEGEKILSSDDIVRVVIDRQHEFLSTALDASMLYYLREQLSEAILYKVSHSTDVLLPVLRAAVDASACILSCDGLSGTSTSTSRGTEKPSDPASQNTAKASASSIQSAHINDGASMTGMPIFREGISPSEWLVIRNPISWNASSGTLFQRMSVQWTLPEVGWMKANVDGSIRDHEHEHLILAACGGVFRDAAGAWCFGFARNFGPSPRRSSGKEFWLGSPDVMECRCVTRSELWGILTALELAKGKGISQLWIESDCVDAVNSILNRRVQSTDPWAFLVRRILELMRGNWTVRISHCFREANAVADWLTSTFAHNTEVGLHVLSKPPKGCVKFLTGDISGCRRRRRVSLGGTPRKRISLKLPLLDG